MTLRMTRKAFCARMAGSSVVLLFQACGGGGSSAPVATAPPPAPPPPAPAPAPSGLTCTDAIGANHGHDLVIPAADLASLVDKVYNIQGTAIHNHTVTLTVADFIALKAGASFSAISTTTLAHEHAVSVTCA
jgi:hypothetical protein